MQVKRQDKPQFRRNRIFIGLAILAVVGLSAAWLVPAGLAALRGEARTECGDTPGILRLETGGLLYTFHVITRTESLFDTRSDPRCLRNLARLRPAETTRMRSRLTRELGVTDLREFCRAYEPVIHRLRGLGYF